MTTHDEVHHAVMSEAMKDYNQDTAKHFEPKSLKQTMSGPVEGVDWGNMKTPGLSLTSDPRPSIIHRIKSVTPYFEAVQSTNKHAELRRDDRDYQVGDYLVINHCIVAENNFCVRYTNQRVSRKITHVLRDMEGMRKGYCVISMEPVDITDPCADYLLRHPEPEEHIKGRRKREAKMRELEGRQAEEIKAAWREIAPNGIKSETVVPRGFTIPKNGHEAFRSIADDVDHIEPTRTEVNPAPTPLEIDAAGFLGIPDDVYWNEGHQNFYHVDGAGAHGCGTLFYQQWVKHAEHFPQSASEVVARSIPNRLPAESKATPHENELLLHLTQEASEVIQAVTKLQFFGKKTVMYRGVQYDNAKDLGVEIGNLQHMINVVQACGLVDEKDVKHGTQKKLVGLDKHLTKK